MKIISDFVEYFNFKLFTVKLTPESENILKFYINLFLLFLKYIKKPNEKLVVFWCQLLRPSLNQNYSSSNDSKYNKNTDIKLLMTQIDEIINKSDKDENYNINEVNVQNNNNILNLKQSKIKHDHRPHYQSLSPDSVKGSKTYDKHNKSFIKNDIIIENLNDNKEIELTEQKDILMIFKNKNEPSNNNIKHVNFNLINKRASKINQKMQNSIRMSKSKSVNMFREMKGIYTEKDETENKYIEYYSNYKKIKLIDVDLLLKKIAENSLSEEDNKTLYSFIKQSFSFLKIDIFLKKVAKCYEFHKSQEENLSQKVINLVEFFNAYIIEYMIYNKNIISDEKILGIINSFYSDLKSDVMSLIKNKNLEGISKNKQMRNKIMEEKICTKMTNKNNETVKWWMKDNVKKKIKDYFKLNRLRYILIEKEKISLFRKSKIINNKNKINNSLSQDKIIVNQSKSNESSRNNSGISISLSLDKTSKSDKKQSTRTNQNIMRHSNTRDNIFRTDSAAINQTGKITDDFLVHLVGKIYESTIKNTELIVSREESFLSSLKNITNLLNIKSYNEAEILNIKNKENFYSKLNDKKRIGTIRYKTVVKKNEILLNKFMSLSESININNIPQKKYFCVTDYKVAQIGEELILVSKKSLNSVEYKELYCAIFTKNQKNEKSPNIMDNIKKFNNLIFFIVEDILSYDTPKERAKMIDQWALIAKYCKKRKDQSDCLAINSALNHYIITGLNQTFDSIKHSTKNILKEIGEYCSLKGNYKTFREEVKNLKENEFYLPYLGYIMRDINFFEEKGKYMVQGNMVNFEKIENVQNTLDIFFKFKDCFDRIKIEGIKELSFFENLEVKNEQELEQLADNLEPEFKLEKQIDGSKRLTAIDIKYFGNKKKKE